MVVLAVLAVACAAFWAWRTGEGRASREVHDDDHGILSASTGSGGVSVDAPRRKSKWAASFGGMLLCVTEPGAAVEIERIRTTVAKEPLSLRHRFRHVPLEEKRVGSADEWSSFISSWGIHPHLDVGPMRGTFGPARGTITQPCDGPKGVFHQFTELVTEMKVDRTGGRIVRTLIDYTSGGKKYTLVVNWKMTACGSQTPEDCDRG